MGPFSGVAATRFASAAWFAGSVEPLLSAVAVAWSVAVLSAVAAKGAAIPRATAVAVFREVPVGEKKRVQMRSGCISVRCVQAKVGKIRIFVRNVNIEIRMKTKMLACAALLLAACGGTRNPEAEKTAETRTEVRYGEEIALVQVPPKGGLTIDEALRNRRSWREYDPGALSLEELSGIVWAAAGENRPEEGRLTAPSALALYPVRLYVFFAEGVYRYDAEAHRLVRVLEGDRRRLSGAQPFVYSAPLNLVYVADRAVYEGRSIPAEQVRYLCGQDAAGCAENVNLYAAGHGLRSITRGSAPAGELLEALGLDPERYFLALAQTVGR